jgi:hypothetical protein
VGQLSIAGAAPTSTLPRPRGTATRWPTPIGARPTVIDTRWPTATAGPSSDGGSGSGASAICNDGTYSYSRHRRGTCSWHGGVRQWLKDLPP